MKRPGYLVCYFFIMFAVACERMDMIEKEYPDIDAAIEAGAIEAGRVPAYFPLSARNIKEVHNIDTHEMWIKFSMRRDGIDEIEEACVQIDYEAVRFPRRAANVWWPKGLTVAHKDSVNRSFEYEFYSCNDRSFMAIHESEDIDLTVFYWMHARWRGALWSAPSTTKQNPS